VPPRATTCVANVEVDRGIDRLGALGADHLVLALHVLGIHILRAEHLVTLPACVAYKHNGTDKCDRETDERDGDGQGSSFGG
jgi:hypothetical protein